MRRLPKEFLADGSADLVGMVRALIADPDLPNKVRSGRVEDVRMCLGLSECHHIGPHRTPLTCAVNAAAAREDEMEIVPAADRRPWWWSGAGPAGLETARVAALRGHHVYLADRRRQIGVPRHCWPATPTDGISEIMLRFSNRSWPGSV